MPEINKGEYFDSIVREVKNKLEEYIKLSGREITASGMFKCMMPNEHSNKDETPSAHISTRNGTKVWYCQVCKVGGSVIDLAHFSEGLPIHGDGFKRTVLDLAARLNVEVNKDLLPESALKPQEDIGIHSMLDMYREIEHYLVMHGNADVHLTSGEFGRTYTESDAKRACDMVPMGVVRAEELTKHMRERFNNRIESLPFYDERTCLLAPYVFNEDCLVLSTRDRLGRPISFSARAKDSKCSKDLPQEQRYPKYRHTKGFDFLKKNTLFMFDVAKGAIKDSHSVRIVEGQFDTISMHLAGFTNTVGILGSYISPEAMDLLLVPYGIYTVTEIVDNDKAGVAAVKRSLDVLRQYDVVVQAVALPEGDDPDSVYMSGNLDILNVTMDAIEYVIRHHYDFHDRTKPAEVRFKDMLRFVATSCAFPVKYRKYAEIIGEYFAYYTEDILSSMNMEKNVDSKLIREENKIMSKIRDVLDKPIQEKINVVERSLGDLKMLSASSRPAQKRTTWSDFMALATGQKEFPRVLKTGIRQLDKHADIEVGSLTFMSGFPSNGKSSVLQYLSTRMLSMYDDLKVLYVSTDDILEKAIACMVAISTGIPKKTVRNMFSDGTLMKQAQVSSKLEDLHEMFTDRIVIRGMEDCYNVPTIRSELEDMARTHSGPILTIVDAIQDLQEMASVDQRVATENIIRDFKSMAPTYHTAMIAVSHLTKQSHVKPRRPVLRDLKGSSFLEFAAKTILLVYMDMHYNPESELSWRKQGFTGGENFPVVEIETAKDKDNKAAEKAFMHFNPLVGSFEEPTQGLITTYEKVVRNAIANNEETGSGGNEGIGGDFF